MDGQQIGTLMTEPFTNNPQWEDRELEESIKRLHNVLGHIPYRPKMPVPDSFLNLPEFDTRLIFNNINLAKDRITLAIQTLDSQGAPRKARSLEKILEEIERWQAS